MSKAWTPPRWWPQDQRGHTITGFSLELLVLPELDNWKFGRLGSGIISIGPLRVGFGPVGINRARDDSE